MKSQLFTLLILLLLAANLKAQDYLVDFTGTGESSTVTTVKVENLTAGTSLTINGTDVLRLTSTVNISDVENEKSSGLKIYPNPMTDKSKLIFFAPEAGIAVISIYDITGRQITEINSYVENNTQEFALSGIKSGIYIVTVKGSSYQLSGRLISNNISDGKPGIEKVSGYNTVDEKVSKMDSKGVQATIDMEYTTGDRIKFKGISGIYSTVITDIPEESKTITFNFIACTDGDDNNYAVVELGTQVWMAENLKTTKYQDDVAIPNVDDNTAWSDLTTGGYCWYNNDGTTNKDTYGALYNWFAVHTGKLCPTGWHVPTTDEWTTLVDLAGGVVQAGAALKEVGYTHWNSPNTGALDAFGFTALPGGGRSGIDGSFDYLGTKSYISSANENDDLNAVGRAMSYNASYVATLLGVKKNGWSVRCVKD